MGPSRCSAKFAKIPSEACPWPTCSECRAMCPFCRCLLAFSRGALTILARFRDGWRNGGGSERVPKRGVVCPVGAVTWNILGEAVEHW